MNRTVPDERHFFCEMSAGGTRIKKVKLPQWNTYAEIVALREFRVFREFPIEAHYCPVPPHSSTLRKGEWWMRHEDRHYVLKEAIKLAAYHAILSMPEAMIRRIMRLKNWPK